MSQRDVGLFGSEYTKLRACIVESQPDLLIIDPLRYALAKQRGPAKGTGEEVLAIKAIDQISQLRDLNGSLAIILAHHLKKTQEFAKLKIKLDDDPRSWIEQSYGSQALLAHVDTIIGLEQDSDHYTLATVPRSHEPKILHLEKQDSQRFLLMSDDIFVFKTAEQQAAWSRLPDEFGWREITHHKQLVKNNLFRAVIGQALPRGLLEQDPKTKRYRKVKGANDENTEA